MGADLVIQDDVLELLSEIGHGGYVHTLVRAPVRLLGQQLQLVLDSLQSSGDSLTEILSDSRCRGRTRIKISVA